ncbi:MAG: hypothetical protein IKT52_13075 [Oscillospiraceae bacterium]|nr:hypothetical protein [Oscillospiraceae bacterium]
MALLQTQIRRGLDAWQLKMIAVVFMTIDHLGAYGFEIPIFETYNTKLRLLGRIAMPLFLFALTESIRYTRNRKKFLLRLYLGAVGSGLFVTVTNFLFHDSIGSFINSNIFFTYFYVALYVILIEEIIRGIQEKAGKRIALGILGIAATCIPHILLVLLVKVNIMDYGASLYTAIAFQDLVCSFLESPIHVEYTILFVLMGIMMYFAKDKVKKAAVLFLFSVFCYVGGKVQAISTSSLCFVVGFPQYYMILAVPFLLLYNGEKGRGNKYFFYFYYPLHRYAISIAVYIYQLLTGA